MQYTELTVNEQVGEFRFYTKRRVNSGRIDQFRDLQKTAAVGAVRSTTAV